MEDSTQKKKIIIVKSLMEAGMYIFKGNFSQYSCRLSTVYSILFSLVGCLVQQPHNLVVFLQILLQLFLLLVGLEGFLGPSLNSR